MVTASAMTDVSDVPGDSNSPPTLDVNVELGSLQPLLDVQPSGEVAILQKAHDLRQHRKLTSPAGTCFRENWDRQYRHHADAWTELFKICDSPKSKLPLDSLFLMQKELEEHLARWRDSKNKLKYIQSNLEDPEFQENIHCFEAANKECKDTIQEGRNSLQAAILNALQKEQGRGVQNTEHLI